MNAVLIVVSRWACFCPMKIYFQALPRGFSKTTRSRLTSPFTITPSMIRKLTRRVGSACARPAVTFAEVDRDLTLLFRGTPR